jgi:outer membrane receptor protein involved in Fe transport
MQNTPGTGTATVTYTVVVNGATTALTIGMLPTATTAQDTTDSVAVSAGDQIVIQLTKSASIGAVNQIVVTVEFV